MDESSIQQTCLVYYDKVWTTKLQLQRNQVMSEFQIKIKIIENQVTGFLQ